MGCDIHHAVEVRKDGVWHLHWANTIGRHYIDDDETYSSSFIWGDAFDQLPKTYQEKMASPFVIDRDYDVFAILGNVRNTDGARQFVSMSDKWGLPDDATKQVKAWARSWGVGGHSHSFVTLKEMLTYDFDRPKKRRALTDIMSYADWLLNRDGIGPPFSYCFSAIGNDALLTNEEAKEFVNEHKEVLLEAVEARKARRERLEFLRSNPKPISADGVYDEEHQRLAKESKPIFARLDAILGGRHHYTTIEFQESYHDCAPHLVDVTIPALQKLGDPEDVRLVFFFDN